MAFHYRKPKGDGSNLELPPHTGHELITAVSSKDPAFGSIQTQAAAHMVLGLAARWLLFVDTFRHWRRVCCLSGLHPGYLETRELLWDWPEEDKEVAALSWEKPLVQDSRLDMEPLGRKGAAQMLPFGGDAALGPVQQWKSW